MLGKTNGNCKMFSDAEEDKGIRLQRQTACKREGDKPEEGY